MRCGVRVGSVGPTVEEVRAAMRKPLPGRAAQITMAPRPRPIVPPADVTPRQAAVLLLLYHLDSPPTPGGALHTVLTVRPATMNHHAAQVSLPGGGWEVGDRSYRETALREAREELGIPTTAIEILGPLTPLYVPPSNNLVHPFVAYIPRRPVFHPDPKEVAELLEVPLSLLMDPANRREEDWTWRGAPLHVPLYALTCSPYGQGQGQGARGADRVFKVWGATAIVLAEFLALL